MESLLEYPFLAYFAKNGSSTIIHKKRKEKIWRNSQIEGIINNQNVLLVEDLMTDGGSKAKFIESILKVKAKIDAIFVIFNYGINIDFFEFKKKN